MPTSGDAAFWMRAHVGSRKVFDLMVRFLIKSNQISLFLTQLQLQQNELKLNTQNAQLKAGKKKFKVSHQINPVAEAYRRPRRDREVIESSGHHKN